MITIGQKNEFRAWQLKFMHTHPKQRILKEEVPKSYLLCAIASFT